MENKQKRKGCPPRVTRIKVVDDDDQHLSEIVNALDEAFPKLRISGHGSIYGAYSCYGHPDYLLIDISSVAPLMMSDVHHAYGPISKY